MATTSPTTKQPFWVGVDPKKFVVHTAYIGGNDIFTALVMGLKVKKYTRDQLFVGPNESRNKLTVSDILTREGTKQFWESRVGFNGWQMLHYFSNFAQTNPRLPSERIDRLCMLSAVKAVAVTNSILFEDVTPGKRKFEAPGKSKFERHDVVRRALKTGNFERLVTPLLPDKFTGTQADIDHISATLLKVKHGVFDTGEVCRGGKSGQRAVYQLEKIRGKGVTHMALNNEWALFLTATLKVRVTIRSRLIPGIDSVDESNNDDILRILWSSDMQTDPNIMYTFDQVLMCRPNDGILRAVRIDTERSSRWSQLWLSDPTMIPTQTSKAPDPAVILPTMGPPRTPPKRLPDQTMGPPRTPPKRLPDPTITQAPTPPVPLPDPPPDVVCNTEEPVHSTNSVINQNRS
jgi:hypothetical protein